MLFRSLVWSPADGVGPAIVAIDRLRLGQVVENVVTNALKFSPSDAPVLIEPSLEEAALVIAVSDDGPGVAPGDRERLFERFERLGAREPGIGLGMYLSREIARAHSGELEVAEPRRRGATFVLRVPLVPERAAQDQRSATSAVDRKSTRLKSSHTAISRMPSSA